MDTSQTPLNGEKNHNERRPHQLRNAFILAIVITFTCLVATFITGIRQMEDKHNRQMLGEEFKIAREGFEIQKADTKKLLAVLCDAICLNPTTQQLWLEGDRKKLLEHVMPLYRRIFLTADVTHFYFHSPSGVNFLRMHQPSRFGDAVERNTLLEAQKTGLASYGMELGPLGTFTLRYVQPWYIDGKLVGYVELGKEVDSVYHGVTELLGGNSVILLSKENLHEKDWQKGMDFLQRTRHWNQYSDYVVIAQYPPGESLVFVDQLLEKQDKDASLPQESYSEIGGDTFQVGALELKDMRGRSVGYFIFERNVTANLEATTHFIETLVALTIVVAALIIVLGTWLLSRVERQVNREHRRVEEQLAFQYLQNNIIARFVNYDPEKWGDLVDESLHDVCQFVKADGAYTIGYFESEKKLSHVQGWSVTHGTEAKQVFKDIKIEDAQWWVNMLSKGKPVLVTGDDISEEADVPQHLYRKFNIKTLLAVPMHYSEDVRGWMMISHRDQAMEWQAKQIKYMESIANVFATAIVRHRAEEAVRTYTEKLGQSNVRLKQARAKAEEVARAKSEFLANMSHEIRTPMTAILGFAENLVAPDISDEDRIEAADTIYRNGNHLLQLINDILDFSKVETGRIKLEKIPCPLIRVVSDVVLLMGKRAEEKNIFVKSKFLSSMPEVCESDPTRLRQILLNLVGNAIKFTEHGGVTIVSKMDKSSGGGDLYVAEVTDTGIGMEEKQLSQVFQPFTQADDSVSRRFGGTGLGLAISLRIAQAMGGDLTVESTPGFSTTFRLTVPVLVREGTKWVDDPTHYKFVSSGEGSEKIVSDGGIQGYRILLAEDGKDNQRIISLLLRKMGATVTIAENGSEAIRMIEQAEMENQPFELVLMDMHMPVLDGYAATRRLRQAGFRLPIIALTASVMPEDRNKCLSAGCDDYATKPIQREKFFETLNKYLHKIEH